MPLLHFEDLAIGRRFDCGPYPVTRDEIVEFAREFDPQPHHLDEETAKRSILGGLAEPGLNALIREGYRVLDLITFFTAGPKEARAWTVTSGSKAPKAAGAIHTDFEKGFIRAETIGYGDYVELGGETGAKAAGKMRLEGKEDVVRDGDVMLFRFAN